MFTATVQPRTSRLQWPCKCIKHCPTGLGHDGMTGGRISLSFSRLFRVSSLHSCRMSVHLSLLGMAPARRNEQLLFPRGCVEVIGACPVSPTPQASICPGLPPIHLPYEVRAAWWTRMRPWGEHESRLNYVLSHCFLYSNVGSTRASLYRT